MNKMALLKLQQHAASPAEPFAILSGAEVREVIEHITALENGTAPREGSIKLEDMDLRDNFAGLALQGMLAAEPEDTSYNADQAADRAYKFADAMIKARSAA